MPGLILRCGGRAKRLNILLAISDDQSWPHAGAYGCDFVKTPAFDRIAEEGILFTHGYCPAPQCSPCRAALLTGRNIWQLEEAGTHASLFPGKYQVYPELLEASGYFVGYTGKPWGPGNWQDCGRKRNPAGQEFNRHSITADTSEIGSTDYAGNFKDFLEARPDGQPFCFWYGAREPHRTYEQGSGLRAGKKLEDVEVPPFLPDTKAVRSDLLDYALEIEWFDRHLARMLQILEDLGELDQTLLIVTSDNGMPFPRAKANLYEYGTHMPLAIRWGDRIRGGRTVDDLVSFIDLAPTFLEAAGLETPPTMTGRSLMKILDSSRSGRIDPEREYVLTGRERHTHTRPDNLGYPSRALRTAEYLYICNFKPDRWPAGDPPGYHDIDDYDSPSKAALIENVEEEEAQRLFDLAIGKRPAEELYAVENDPGCLHNLADDLAYERIRDNLHAELERVLTAQGDPRVLGYGDIFESYPRFNRMRDLEGFKEYGKYNPKFIQEGQYVPEHLLPESH
ncbi:MAG: sulfatase [Fidelibacterota bacterium]|nr:MAG: sulfatase [Candidatus Neomarinimicrobiota bacterium]